MLDGCLFGVRGQSHGGDFFHWKMQEMDIKVERNVSEKSFPESDGAVVEDINTMCVI